MTTLAGPGPPKRTLKLTGSGFRGRKRGKEQAACGDGICLLQELSAGFS